jgi:hypothetical protein
VQTTTLGTHNNAQAGNSFDDSLQRTSLAAGQYGSVVATWDTVNVTVPIAFNVLGNYRFSTYNTPYESQCGPVQLLSWHTAMRVIHASGEPRISTLTLWPR